MSYQTKRMTQWTQNDVISWIKSLPTAGDFNDQLKQDLVAGIENGDGVSGQDLFECEDASDVKGLTGVDDKQKAKLLLEHIEAHSSNAFDEKNGDQDNDNSQYGSEQKFDINIVGQQGLSITIKNVTRKTTISDIKRFYLDENGNSAAADSYRSNQKWSKGTDGEGKISFRKGGKSVDDDATLESIGIVNGLALPLFVGFHVIGGAEEKHGDDQEDKDRFRKRKIRFKKHKGVIRKSNKADCIMGYTDSDGIPRAEMPCGCAMASDTMWRYMKALFEKDFKSAKLYCPVNKKFCGGTDEQREWDWSLVFAIADLSQKEIIKYSRIINNRLSGSKDCPHCGTSTEKPAGVRIWRVRCTTCKKSDWCWACQGVWKAAGLGPICGNQNCMSAQINGILKQCDWVDVPSDWKHEVLNEQQRAPQIRACPNCVTILEYTKACKHMWCLCCPHEFCFHCLKKWDQGCKHGNICPLAPIQQFQ